MSRFSIQHPTDTKLKAYYGHDVHGLGWWAEIWRGRKLIESYDNLRPGNTSVEGILRLMVEHKFFGDLGELVVAETHSMLPHIDDLAEFDDPDERLAGEVILNLKSSARD